MRTGIVGLPNAGKSTLFNVITRAGAASQPYPFTTIEPNLGDVPLPDPRLDAIADIVRPESVTPAHLEFVDIAGLVRNASRGEGLGNQFLDHIRQVDALAHVIRCFHNEDIPHLYGDPDPARDLEIVETELVLADLEQVRRQVHRLGRRSSQEEDAARVRLAALDDDLARGIPVRLRPGTADPVDRQLERELGLLTAKPVLVVLNAGGDDDPREAAWLAAGRDAARAAGATAIVVCGRIEDDLNAMDAGEAAEFRAAYGIEKPAIDRMVLAGFAILDLVAFFTSEHAKLQEWTVARGTPAPQAAGRIHSDMERGFISAEVVSCGDLLACGSLHAARDTGKLRTEGKEYKVRDGDILRIRFSV